MMTVVASSSWGGLGWFWVPIMAVMMVGCMLMMGGMMGGMMRHGGHGAHHGQHHEQPPDSAERILADRLARGEIDVEEYNRLLAAIHPNGELHRHKAGTPGE